MSKVVVTGGAGFLGSHLATGLLDAGYEVVVIDNLATGRISNLDHIKDRIQFLQMDINDTAALTKACEGAEFVFHAAAIPAVPRSIDDPVGTNHANIDGTLSVLMAAKVTGVKRVVYSSSSSVYGDSPVLPKREDMATAPISPYGTQKLAAEQYVMHFNTFFNLETVALRYFNVFGPRQDPNSPYSAVIPLFITLMKAGKSPLVHGNGSTTRDFTYVENVVKANILAATVPDARGHIFNIACNEQQSLNALIATIGTALGTNVQPEYGPFRAGDIKDSLADISKAKQILGYEPAVSFEEGIKRTIASLS